jgi:hypothetical protein
MHLKTGLMYSFMAGPVLHAMAQYAMLSALFHLAYKMLLLRKRQHLHAGYSVHAACGHEMVGVTVGRFLWCGGVYFSAGIA